MEKTNKIPNFLQRQEELVRLKLEESQILSKSMSDKFEFKKVIKDLSNWKPFNIKESVETQQPNVDLALQKS